jgi:hypothetical protein
MPDIATLARFIAQVESNKHDDAINEFYTENASIRENQSEPRQGRANLVAGEKTVLAKARSVWSKCIAPVFVNGDYVVIRWRFRFEWMDGTVTEMEELAYQRWDGNLIAEEQFFYDPVQRQPKKESTKNESGERQVLKT